jgi:hypothetical protein
VWQGQRRSDPDVFLRHRVGSPPGRVRQRGAGHYQVRTHTVDLECGAHGGDPAQLAVWQRHLRQRAAGRHDLLG